MVKISHFKIAMGFFGKIWENISISLPRTIPAIAPSNIFQWNFNQFHSKCISIVFCKMASILFRPQCVNNHRLQCIQYTLTVCMKITTNYYPETMTSTTSIITSPLVQENATSRCLANLTISLMSVKQIYHGIATKALYLYMYLGWAGALAPGWIEGPGLVSEPIHKFESKDTLFKSGQVPRPQLQSGWGLSLVKEAIHKVCQAQHVMIMFLNYSCTEHDRQSKCKSCRQKLQMYPHVK